jgi:formylglycine-generating enzyme required for sulfatase activity/lipoprotein NlpI
MVGCGSPETSPSPLAATPEPTVASAPTYTLAPTVSPRPTETEPQAPDFTPTSEPISSQEAITHYERGLIHQESGDFEGAIERFSQAIELDPNFAQAYSDRGVAHSNIDDLELAILDFDQAIEIDPNYADAYYNRGLCHKRMGHYDEAIEDYSRAIELEPDFAYAYVNRGNVYRVMGELDQAITDFNIGIELDPTDKLAYKNRGDSYYAKGEFELAITDYEKAIELDSQYTYAFFNRGIAHAELGMVQEAVCDLDKAINLGVAPEEEERARYYIEANSSSKAEQSPPTASANISTPSPVPISEISEDLPPAIIDESGVTMVLVPAGPFTMGIETDKSMEECEKITFSGTCDREHFSDSDPAHRVEQDDFYIDITEVTNAMYALCVEAGFCSGQRDAASYTRADYALNSDFDNYPVIWVPWEYAQTYCAWRGARLPTEAEWEKAARGTDGRLYPWGDEFYEGYANYCDPACRLRGYNDTLPVGSFPAGASPYGVLDMAGNVNEWVTDYYNEKYYTNSPTNNPKGPETGDSGHVMRGGSWAWPIPPMFTTFRNYTDAYSSDGVGFRCAFTP